jgi:CO dehydrogenase/acetyl-CoA synthase delta subunit
MDKNDLTARLQNYGVEELEFIAKQAKLEAKQKQSELDKQAHKQAVQKKLEDQKAMTALKQEEQKALWEKQKNERRAQFSGKIKKGDIVSFLLKGSSSKPVPHVGEVVKATPFGVRVNASASGVLHEYEPELTVDYGFITSVCPANVDNFFAVRG